MNNELELLYKTARLSNTAKSKLLNQGYLVADDGIHTPKGDIVPHYQLPTSVDGYEQILREAERVKYSDQIIREVKTTLLKEFPLL